MRGLVEMVLTAAPLPETAHIKTQVPRLETIGHTRVFGIYTLAWPIRPLRKGQSFDSPWLSPGSTCPDRAFLFLRGKRPHLRSNLAKRLANALGLLSREHVLKDVS